MAEYLDELNRLGFNVILPLNEAQNYCDGTVTGPITDLTGTSSGTHGYVYGGQDTLLLNETDSMQFLQTHMYQDTNPCDGGPVISSSYSDVVIPEGVITTTGFTQVITLDLSDHTFIDQSQQDSLAVSDLYNPDIMYPDASLRQYVRVTFELNGLQHTGTIYVTYKDTTTGDVVSLHLVTLALYDLALGNITTIYNVAITFIPTLSGTPHEGYLTTYLNGVQTHSNLVHLDQKFNIVELGISPNTIKGIYPIASIVPTSGEFPLNVTFDASGSIGDGLITYEWDFGDGNTDTGLVVAHTYPAAGSYTVILTVSNDTGRTVSRTYEAVITVTDPPVFTECQLVNETPDPLVDEYGNNLMTVCP